MNEAGPNLTWDWRPFGAHAVAAELRVLEQKDIEVEAERRARYPRQKENRDADKDRLFSERYYGRFEGRIPPDDIDQDKINASFERGPQCDPPEITSTAEGETDAINAK
jgi:hypothetical protein